jgi:Uma2 family endonuclease
METTTLMGANKRRWTDRQLMSLPRDGRKYELLEGDLVVSPVGLTHSLICVRLVMLLGAYARRRKCGEVFDSSMGYRLSPEVLLSPDVSYVSNDRLAQLTIAPEKFLYGAPDLAVEVLSPGDSRRITEAKLGRYFQHGTRLAWLVDAKRQSVTAFAPDGAKKLLSLADSLNAGGVLPGFRCKLHDIFSPL